MVSVSLLRSADSVMVPPRGVNLTAFDSRFADDLLQPAAVRFDGPERRLVVAQRQSGLVGRGPEPLDGRVE